MVLWNGASLWIGHDAGLVQAHDHHAIQVSMALTGSLRLRTREGRWQEYTAAIIRPHERHEFDGNDQAVAHLFVEPETQQGRALLSRHVDAISRLTVPELAAGALRTAYRRSLPDAKLQELSESLIARLAGMEASLCVDPRITTAIAWMRAHLKDPLSLERVAREAHLSPSRFRHLFVAQTGISFRAYLLWARVSSAVGAAMHGANWTDAAQAWGFADSAHLSRTCRRMFGIAPSMLVRAQPSSP